MQSKYLAIVGNARTVQPEELEGYEVWALGTGNYEKADRYYEFHGLPCKEPTFRMNNIPIDALHREGLPLMNSICIMLAEAIYSGWFYEIKLVGCPLRDKTEYIAQKPAVAFLVGLAKGKGIRVSWEQSGLDFINVYMMENKEFTNE